MLRRLAPTQKILSSVEVPPQLLQYLQQHSWIFTKSKKLYCLACDIHPAHTQKWDKSSFTALTRLVRSVGNIKENKL